MGKKSVYKTRVEDAVEHLRKTGNLQDFAHRMADIGDVRYDWQSQTVHSMIGQIVPQSIGPATFSAN